MSETYDLKEKIIHGSPTFPLCVYHMSLPYFRQLFDCHWHDEYEILYIVSGEATMQSNSDFVEVRGGQAVIFNPGEVHTGYSLNDSHCEYFAIVFDINMLASNYLDVCQSEYINPLIKKKYALPLLIDNNEQWKNCILSQVCNIIQEFDNKLDGYELEIKSSLYKILSAVIRSKAMKAVSNDKAYKLNNLKRILNYIHSNYQTNLSVAELSREFNMSTAYFCRFFKSMTGRTPIDYINYYRITRAAKMLDEDRKVMDVALDVGFNNFSYFIRTFKDVMGCVPTRYRRECTKL